MIILHTYISIIILPTYNSIIILPTYNSISITGFNENLFFFHLSYCSLQYFVHRCLSLCPFSVGNCVVYLSSVYVFVNYTFSNFKRFLHLHFELSRRKISKYKYDKACFQHTDRFIKTLIDTKSSVCRSFKVWHQVGFTKRIYFCQCHGFLLVLLCGLTVS